ncbi:MAG: phospholipase [Chitinophagaceae bacterium]|nr:phospholipase [Chitinophagaceae bacterium]
MVRRKKNTTTYRNLNKAKLVRGGTAYFDLLINLINQATESIHLQTYIFNDDLTGTMVAEALKNAAKRNVSVFLMADGYASQGMSKKFITDLVHTGVQFRFFEPFFKSKQFYFGRRMHHKVFVADARFALTGGINIADRYNDLPQYPAWTDFALYTEGEIAKDLCILCWKAWNGFPLKMGPTPCDDMKPAFDFKDAELSKLVMRRNDWIKRKNEISATYIDMFRHAKSHITIMCSYFLPGKAIRRALKNAAMRGVKIQVITAGTSDVMLSKYAERWMYDWLLRNKIELFEYQPTILHAKVSVCDSEWMTIGSYNINNLSAHASVELNIDVYNPGLAKQMEQIMKTIIDTDSIAITEKQHKQSTNIFKQFIRWSAYEIIRFMLFIVTFNLKERR